MNKRDEELLEKAAVLMPLYERARPRKAPGRLSRFLSVNENRLIVALGLPILLVTAGSILHLFMPARPSGVEINLTPFIVAVALSGLISGRLGAWVATLASLLVVAWIVPPYHSLEIEAELIPWFAGVCISFAAISMMAWRRGWVPPPRLSRAFVSRR